MTLPDYCRVSVFSQWPHKLFVGEFDDKTIGENAATLSASVCQRLQKERIEKDLSIYRLARLSGLNERSIDFIEKGERTPTIDTLFRIALALDLNASDLLRDAEAETLK